MAREAQTDEDCIDDFSLVGSTLKVYWFFLCRGRHSIGLRRVQRELGFASPSSAIYQLDKLTKMGLVEKDDMGDYVLRRVAKTEFLSNFIFLQGHAIPKDAIFGVTTLLVDFACLSSLLSMGLPPLVYLGLVPGIVSSVIFWYEATRISKHKRKMTAAIENGIVRRSREETESDAW
jgi:DNA-binding transcriptional ArsR family regulator